MEVLVIWVIDLVNLILSFLVLPLEDLSVAVAHMHKLQVMHTSCERNP